MALNMRHCLMSTIRYPSIKANLTRRANSIILNTKFVKSDRYSFLWSSPIRKSSTVTQAANRQGELSLTESCVKRLKKICEDDNSYLRVMVIITEIKTLIFLAANIIFKLSYFTNSVSPLRPLNL